MTEDKFMKVFLFTGDMDELINFLEHKNIIRICYDGSLFYYENKDYPLYTIEFTNQPNKRHDFSYHSFFVKEGNNISVRSKKEMIEIEKKKIDEKYAKLLTEADIFEKEKKRQAKSSEWWIALGENF